MKYSSILKWLHAVWNPDSQTANEVVDDMVESAIVNQRTYAQLIIHFKNGRQLEMRAWVEPGRSITEHVLWKGMTDWLNDGDDNTPYFFNADGDTYHTCIVKSEVARIELMKEKVKA